MDELKEIQGGAAAPREPLRPEPKKRRAPPGAPQSGARAASIHAIAHSGLLTQPLVLFAPVRAIPVELSLLAVKQFSDLRVVVHRGAGCGQTVREPALVGADMNLHAEVP